MGALSALGHTAAAFHFRHGWSQRAALTETARQTAAVIGLDWGGGVYVNYLFPQEEHPAEVVHLLEEFDPGR